MKNLIRSKAFTLANQLTKLNPDLTRSDAFRFAWHVAKNNKDLSLLVATTKGGKLISRVVFANWAGYNTPKGTGRPTPAHLSLFVDAAKHYSLAKNSTISVYTDNIITLAA